MKSFWDGIKNNSAAFWSALVNWFERGDLVPLLVLVSAVHYAAVLAGKDKWEVAVAIGLLVDLGHFRTIRAAVRYSVPAKRGKRKGFFIVRWLSRFNAQMIARWLIAAGMTAVSLAYHQRYYNDLWLSIPLPALIAALAWLQYVDRPATKKKVPQEPPQPTQAERDEAKQDAFVCGSCQKVFRKQQALAAHSKTHLRVKRNGHEKEPVIITTN